MKNDTIMGGNLSVASSVPSKEGETDILDRAIVNLFLFFGVVQHAQLVKSSPTLSLKQPEQCNSSHTIPLLVK